MTMLRSIGTCEVRQDREARERLEAKHANKE
jgi:hypothetical protein